MLDPPRRIAAALAGAGVVLCVLGWYQIAGQPTVPQQLPYLASATIPGAALLVVGLVLSLRTPLPRDIVPHATPPSAPTTPGRWRVPDGRYLHTADCPLLDGRTDAIKVADNEDVHVDVDVDKGNAEHKNENADSATSPPSPCPLCSR